MGIVEHYSLIHPSLGVYIQNTIMGGSGYGWIEICGSDNGSAYIDFTTVNTDFKGRFSFTLSNNQWDWTVNGGSSKMPLNSGGVSVGGTFVSASDKRLKFNDKPSIG